MFIAVALLVVFVAYCVKVKISRRELEKFGETLPGPKPLPLIGNLFAFAGSQRDIWEAYNKIHQEYDSPLRFWMGPKLYVGVDKPKDNEIILTSQFSSDKGEIYSIIAESIGYGLIQSNGEKHKIHRRIMMPPLKINVLENHISKFNTVSEQCSKNLEKFVGQKDFNVILHIENYAMALVTDVILDVNINHQENETLTEIFSLLYTAIAERLYKIWLHPYITFRLSNNYKTQSDKLSYVNSFLNKQISSKISESSKYEESNEMILQTSLKWMLNAKDKENKPIFTFNEIREQLITLYTASQDTTATVVSFVLLLLAMHKDEQQKVWEEQMSIMGSQKDLSAPIDMNQISKMTYLHMVIQEMLRLFPIAPILIRKITNDIQLGDKIIPKNTNVTVNVYHTHRNGAIWPEPDTFNPNRFSQEEKAKRHPYSYMPFGGGIRSCIGQQFAFIAIKCFVSKIIRKYSLDTDWTMNDIKLKSDISIRSIDGYMIRINKR